MTERDEWGKDLSVQSMRRIFKGAEEAQKRLLEYANISFFDLRLRQWRERALKAFERSWANANQMHVIMKEDKAVALYVKCLARVIGSDGINIPSEAVPENREIEMLLKEIIS